MTVFATNRLWWSAGIHAAILVLCLAISAIPPTPAKAIERTHVTLIAPTLPVTPPAAPKKIAVEVATPRPIAAEPKPAPKQFLVPISKSPAPTRPVPVEITSVQPIETIAPVIAIAGPLAPSQLPPPPIVVGKLSGATTSTSPAQSGIVARRTGFSASSGGAITIPEPKQTRAPGFQGAAIADTPAPRAKAATAPVTRPVEIIKKPQPIYTEEARSLRLEGEVLLEVLFTASAEVRVLRVTRGLGHGLDEAAVASASHIEFRPALREGEPADQTVTVHIRFQLAY